MAIQVRPGGVVVRVPKNTPLHKIEQFVISRSGWIHGKLNKLKRRGHLVKTYCDGASHYYLGRRYRLQVIKTTGSAGRILLIRGRIGVYMPPDIADEDWPAWIEDRLRRWYTLRAQAKITEIVRALAVAVGAEPAEVTIKDLRRSWGICRQDRQLSFNWRLILAPRALIEYIVVHELCHLRQPDHSQAFYDLVKKIQPDYGIRAARFKEWAIAFALDDGPVHRSNH